MESLEAYIEESRARRREIAAQIAALNREMDDLLEDELRVRIEAVQEAES